MSQPLIFITGATGFIGAHVVTQALEAGYPVRLSVRKEAQIAALRRHFAQHAAKLDFIVIPDLTTADAFTKALDGATYVFHLASPMPGKGNDFEQDYLKPAVDGTIALLDAATKVNTIKRVVVVSSFLALIPPDALTTGQFTAKEGLNETIPIDAKMSFPDNPRAAAGLKYHASKILAHRATLSWSRSHTPSFSLVTLHPAFVFGRNLRQRSAQDLDGTNAMLWASLTNKSPSIPLVAVDVRDVAAAHVKTLSLPSSTAVEEFVLGASVKEGWTWERVKEFVAREYAFVDGKLKGPFGEPPIVDGTKARTVLGIEWKKMEDTVGSFLGQQGELRGKL